MVLVDDHAMFRTGVRAGLSASTGVEVVGEAGDVEPRSRDHRASPTSCCWTSTCPAAAAWKCFAGRTAPSGTTYLALSVSDPAEDVIGVIRAGARGYVTKYISGPS